MHDRRRVHKFAARARISFVGQWAHKPLLLLFRIPKAEVWQENISDVEVGGLDWPALGNACSRRHEPKESAI